MRGKILATTLVALLVVATGAVSAADWTAIGTQTISYREHSGVIEIDQAAGELEALCLHLEGSEIQLLGIEVLYEGGDSLAMKAHQRLRRGEDGRAIELPRRSEQLKQVKIIYATQGMRPGRAEVVLKGRAATEELLATHGAVEASAELR